MTTLDIDLTGLTKAEGLLIAAEAVRAEAHRACVRNRLQWLRAGSFEEIGEMAEWLNAAIEEELRLYLAEVAKRFYPPKPALRLVSDRS